MPSFPLIPVFHHDHPAKPPTFTTNLASVYLLFCTQAAQQDLGTQWPREHCCQVTSLKVFQHQELSLTSILLNQLHFPSSSANDSKSAPFPLYFQEPAWPSTSSIHSTILPFVPTCTEHPLCARCHARDRDRTESHSAYILVKTVRCWEMMKIKEIKNKQKILVTGCDPPHFLPTCPPSNVFNWGKIHITLN